ncbi:MAG: alpha-hydroxy-acid oxidizing protein [Patulibacter sp.]|nr:alpha-hydroxy-acid oxidizing protein [Patulibacter sp.]
MSRAARAESDPAVRRVRRGRAAARLRDAVTIEDVRRIAGRRLPRAILDLLEGGAGDEVTVARNRDALRRLDLRPRALEDVSARALGTTVLGQPISMPVMLAPTGAGRLMHRTSELAVASAAAAAGTVYVQSTVSAYPLEEVAEASRRTAWFQLYVPPNRADLAPLLARVAAAGYRTLVVTIDLAALGNRERDARNQILNLPMWHPRALAQGFSRPLWGVEFLRGNVGLGAAPERGGRQSLGDTRATIATAATSVTWDDIAVLREQWDGPLVVKGVIRHDECERLVQAGVDGIVVSNHGGRQLDGVPGAIEALPAVVDAVAGRAEVLLDGGIRRGTDVVKALALGASAVLIGRPYLYGLAAAGEPGVRRVLEILRAEIDLTLALVGAASPADLTPDMVGGVDLAERRVGGAAGPLG